MFSAPRVVPASEVSSVPPAGAFIAYGFFRFAKTAVAGCLLSCTGGGGGGMFGDLAQHMGAKCARSLALHAPTNKNTAVRRCSGDVDERARDRTGTPLLLVNYGSCYPC